MNLYSIKLLKTLVQDADNTALTPPLAVGTGVKVVSTQKLFTQGGLVSTDNSLGLTFDGSGVSKLYFPTGDRLHKAGSNHNARDFCPSSGSCQPQLRSK